VALIPVVPRALALVGPEELRREIEERKRVEAQLRDLTARLERSNRELQDFASVASHDLQEPLRKIQAFGDRLQAKSGAALNEEGRDSLGRIQDAVGRMRVLIDDLLRFSRVTTQARPFAPVPWTGWRARWSPTWRGGCTRPRARRAGGPADGRGRRHPDAATAAEPHRQRPEIPPPRGPPGHPGPRPAPAGRRRPPPDGPPPPRYCQISVEDNGIGFDEKYLDRIFNVFQRLHGRGEFEGTGMGLAICRKIAERHNGSITARSTPGQGATFLVTLPLEQPPGGPSGDAQRQADRDPDGR
jgi:signal transduction histidine kinase